MSVKLKDNFQMREHSWPCRFNITYTMYKQYQEKKGWDRIYRLNSANFLFLSYAITWNSHCKYCSLFCGQWFEVRGFVHFVDINRIIDNQDLLCVQWFEVRRNCSLFWYWWNCWSSWSVLSEELLLFNANSAICQLYHVKNKLICNEMMIRSALY